MIDENYLQKSAQYQLGEYVEEGNLCEGIFALSESGFDSTNKNHKFEQNMNMSSLFKVFTTNEIF